MFRLIKNELFKIFHKKSTIITLIIAVLFLVLVNVIYKRENKVTYNRDPEYINYLKSEVEKYEQDKAKFSELASAKSDLEIFIQSEKYQDVEWKNRMIYSAYYENVHNYYYALIVEKNNDNANVFKAKMDEILNKLDNNDWLYFSKYELQKYESDLIAIKDASTISFINDQQKENEIKIINKKIELEKYRIDNNVGYEGYLADAIENINSTYHNVLEYEQTNKKSTKEELASSVKTYYENVYILENKVDTNNVHSLKAVIENLYNEMNFIIFVFIIMIAGAIVSEEYNKGTIKNLLTTPHTRIKLLFSKYITTLLMIPFIVILLLLLELIIGGIVFGFSSLSIPVISYVFTNNSVEAMNVISYYFLFIITKAPMLILMLTLAFSLSTIIGNTAFSIALSLCGYVGAEIINMLAQAFEVKALYYFVTTNWDFSVHLFGGKSPFGLSISHSIIVCVIYLLIMIVTSTIVFKKKNIKNI